MSTGTLINIRCKSRKTATGSPCNKPLTIESGSFKEGGTLICPDGHTRSFAKEYLGRFEEPVLQKTTGRYKLPAKSPCCGKASNSLYSDQSVVLCRCGTSSQYKAPGVWVVINDDDPAM